MCIILEYYNIIRDLVKSFNHSSPYSSHFLRPLPCHKHWWLHCKRPCRLDQNLWRIVSSFHVFSNRGACKVVLKLRHMLGKNGMDMNNGLIFQRIFPGNFRIQPKAPNVSLHQTSASTINHSIYQTLYLTTLWWIAVTAAINMLFYAMLLYFSSSMQSAFNLLCWAEPTKQRQRHLPCTTPKSKFIQRPGTCLKISEHVNMEPGTPRFMSPLPPKIRPC